MNTKITKNPIRRLILAAVVVILAGLNSPISAQESTIEYVTSAPNQQNYKTIVRSYGTDKNIVYRYDGSEHYFSLIDVVTNISRELHIFPASIESINDFCIFENYIIACGKINADNGCILIIDINSTFYLSTPSLGIANVNSYGIPPYRVTNIKKIKAFKAAGETHIVMVADCQHQNGGDTDNSCVIDMFAPALTVLGGWHASLFSFQKKYDSFDDIAVGDDFVATAGRYAWQGYQTIRFFDKPVSPGQSIFNSPLCLNLNYHLYSPLYPVAITHTERNYFVTAAVAEDGGRKGTYVFSYNGPMVYHQERILYPHDTLPSSTIYDMAYDPTTRNLYMLQEVDIPYTTQILNTLDPYVPGASTWIATDLNSIGRFHSLTVDDTLHRAVVSGSSYGMMMRLYQYAWPSTPPIPTCTEPFPEEVDQPTLLPDLFVWPYDIITFNVKFYTLNGTIFSVTKSNVCTY